MGGQGDQRLSHALGLGSHWTRGCPPFPAMALFPPQVTTSPSLFTFPQLRFKLRNHRHAPEPQQFLLCFLGLFIQ